MLGWSLDTARVLAAKVELYKATDLAARELAREIDIAKATSAGQIDRAALEANAGEQVRNNLNSLGSGEVTDIQVEELSSTVIVTSTAEIPLVFSSLAGLKRTTIRVKGLGRLVTIRNRDL